MYTYSVWKYMYTCIHGTLFGYRANLVEQKVTFQYTTSSKGTLSCKLFYFKGNETGFGISAMKLCINMHFPS